MKLNKQYQINYTILDKGTEIEIIEQRAKWNNYNNAQAFLFVVKSGKDKGFVWWDYLSNIKHSIYTIKPALPEIWLNMLSDYIEAGWNCNRIIEAGLLPKRYTALLPQYLKYYEKLKVATSL